MGSSKNIEVRFSLIDDFTKSFQRSIGVLTSGSATGAKAFKNVQKAGENITKVGDNLTKTVTLPIVGIGTASLKMASDFEDGIAKVSTIADTTAMSIDDIRQATLDLSKQTGASVSDISEAQYQAISAGAATADSIDLVNTAIKASRAGFTDTATAIDGLTTIYNSFGMEGSEAYTKIANEMLITQNLGKTTFGELATSLGNLTPTANAAGLSLEDVMTSMSVLTKNGINTSSAATSMKAAISNIVKPTTEAKAAAEALGIQFDTNAIQSKGWMGFLQDIKKHLADASPQYAELTDKIATNQAAMAKLEASNKKSSDEYKKLNTETKAYEKQLNAIAGANNSTISGFASLFGSVEGLNSMMVLTSEQGMNDYNNFYSQMGSNSDILEESFKKMETPSERFRIALNKLKIEGIQIGEKLLPFAERAISVLDQIAEKVSAMSPAQQDQLIKMALMAASIGPMISGFGKMVTTVGTVGRGLNNFANIAGKVTAGMKGASAGAKGLHVVVAGLTSPVGIVVAAVLAFIAVVVLCVKHFDVLKRTIQGSGAFQALSASFQKLKTDAQPLITFFTSLGAKAESVLGTIIPGAVGVLAAAFGGLLTGVVEIIDGIINVITGLAKSIDACVHGDFTGAIDGMKQVFQGLVDFVKGIFDAIFGTIEKIAKAIGSIKGPKAEGGGGVTYEVTEARATGDRNWRGGLVRMNEEGGEIVDLPHGTRIYPHDISKDMARRAGGSTSINIPKLADQIIVREDADIDRIGETLVRKLREASGTKGEVA